MEIAIVVCLESFWIAFHLQIESLSCLLFAVDVRMERLEFSATATWNRLKGF
jgi:hypothetical protein